jgi:hypothetical protein
VTRRDDVLRAVEVVEEALRVVELLRHRLDVRLEADRRVLVGVLVEGGVGTPPRDLERARPALPVLAVDGAGLVWNCARSYLGLEAVRLDLDDLREVVLRERQGGRR